ncbi:tetratricopeptide repeat protein, partial [Patescibacteria group bacterium]|nr:tetratricopeptide repeat protein [Patescibacteria group bacterium]
KLGERADLLQDEFYSQVSTKGIPLKYALEHIATALTKYLELLFWPQHLTLYQSEVYATPLLLVISFMVSIGLALVLIYGFFKNKYVFLGLSLFLISLSPFLTPFGISWWVAERYAYLGTFGIIFLVVLFFSYLGKKYVKFKNIIIALFMIATVLLSIRTVIRNNDWQNEDNLWIATAKKSPSDPKTHNNLGDYYGRHGDQEKAAQEFLKAIELNPFYGDAYHNLANTYQTMGKIDLAIENYKKAVESKPSLWQSYQNLAIIYFNQQDFETAGQYQEKAVEINPNNASLHLNLGVIYQQNNQQEKANLEFQKAVELDPSIKDLFQK